MKLNLPVVDRETTYAPDTMLISLTDRKGIITYANDAFVQVSGFSREELVGKNHNAVRHPDMPPEAFADLWNTLKAGQPWLGIVKNRCKDGSHYWVNAFVAPVYANGEVVGYQSVRTAPRREDVARAARLYARIRAGKHATRLPVALGAAAKTTLAILTPLYLVLGALAWLGTLPAPAALAGLVLGTGMGIALGLGSTRRLRRVAAEARAVFDNPLMRLVYGDSRDEIAQIALTQQLLQAKLRTLLGRLQEAAQDLSRLSAQTSARMAATRDGVARQQIETDQLAAAVNEMAATVQEVARNTADASAAAQRGDRESVSGREVIAQNVQAIRAVAEEVTRVGEVVARLAERSRGIGTVVEVIRNIAEQTNLLALNAAIEAARAGDQGRGFAVVANEVRTLASRTQESTREIQRIIEELQGEASEAVGAMDQSHARVHVAVDHAEKVSESFDAIGRSVATISDMTTQIATAAEEQSAMAAEINRNIANISEVAHGTAASARATAADGEALAAMAADLESVVRQCQT